MRKVEIACVFLAVLATGIIPFPQYTPSKIVQQLNDYNKVAYYKATTNIGSQKSFLFYSSFSNITSLYNGYLYNLINDNLVLGTSPTCLIYFQWNDQSDLIIYGDRDGNVYVTTLNGLIPIVTQLIKNIPECYVQDLSVSSDKTYLAFGCSGSGEAQVNLYNLKNPQDDIDPIDFGSKVYSLDWSRASGQLKLVVGGGKFNDEEQPIPKLTIYDFSTGKPVSKDINVTLQAPGLISSVVYSQYSSIAFIKTSDNVDGQYVYIFDVEKEQFQQPQVAPHAQKLLGLSLNSVYLTAYDDTNVFCFFLQEVDQGKILGPYPSTLASGGVSPDGSDLLTLTEKGLQLSKICPDLTTTFTNAYEQQDLYCIPCTAPCKTCYSQAITCTSCTAAHYFDSKNYACLSCIDNCISCENGTSCEECASTFYYDAGACKLCSEQFEGCLSCVLDQCTTCDTTLNRQKQPDGGKCVCATGYFQEAGSLCESCRIIEGCQTCDNGDNCTTCDATLNREVQPVQGMCQCATGYFQAKFLCESCGTIPGCQTCESGDACETCDANLNRQVQPSEGKCLCATGYFEDAKNLCESCGIIPGCQTCESGDVCQTCDTAGHWAKKQDVCQCEGGYYPDAALCLSCRVAIDWCLSCTSANQCDSCINPLTFNGGKCKCQNNGDTYNPDAGTCEQSNDNTLVIIFIIVGSLLVIGGGGFYLYRRIKKKKNFQRSIVDLQGNETNNDYASRDQISGYSNFRE